MVQYPDKLNDMCIAKAMRCEEKSQSRAAEPVGNEFEDALSIQSESALLQQPGPCIEPPSSSRELITLRLGCARRCQVQCQVQCMQSQTLLCKSDNLMQN